MKNKMPPEVVPFYNGNKELIELSDYKTLFEKWIDFITDEEIDMEDFVGFDPISLLYSVGVSTEEFLKDFNETTDMFTWVDIEEVTIPDNIDTIQEESFALNGKLKRVNLPKSIKLDTACFEATGLEEITIPGGTEFVGNGYQFARNDDLKKVVIEDGVTNIPPCCFLECDDMEELYIPKSVKQIDDTAFMGLGYKLKKVVIPRRFEDRLENDNLIEYLTVDTDKIVTYI